MFLILHLSTLRGIFTAGHIHWGGGGIFLTLVLLYSVQFLRCGHLSSVLSELYGALCSAHNLCNFQIWSGLNSRHILSLFLPTVLASSVKRLALHSCISMSSSLWRMSLCNDCISDSVELAYYLLIFRYKTEANLKNVRFVLSRFFRVATYPIRLFLRVCSRPVLSTSSNIGYDLSYFGNDL